jgi:hypothetical protein
MSQSFRTIREFGSLTLRNSEVKTGSTISVNIVNSPTPVTLGAAVTAITASQVFSGTLVQTPSSALTLTLDTAAHLLATNVNVASVGSSFVFTIINLSGTNAILFAPDGGSGTLVGNATVAVNASGKFMVLITAVGTSPTYTVYRI